MLKAILYWLKKLELVFAGVLKNPLRRLEVGEKDLHL